MPQLLKGKFENWHWPVLLTLTDRRMVVVKGENVLNYVKGKGKCPGEEMSGEYG